MRLWFRYALLAAVMAWVLCLAACASFDKNNIQPGQRVTRPGLSFVVPTEKTWSASEYGTGHRIKLNQFNQADSYSIVVSLTRGPSDGMYGDVDALLKVVQNYKLGEMKPAGLFRRVHVEKPGTEYGERCVQYSSTSEDWRGRNNEGYYALIDVIGLTCVHPEIDNVLANVEISRRYEETSPTQNLSTYAHELFSSIEFDSIDNE